MPERLNITMTHRSESSSELGLRLFSMGLYCMYTSADKRRGSLVLRKEVLHGTSAEL